MQIILGLDIGSHSIKVVEFAKDKNVITLRAAGSALTPAKALSSSLEADQQTVALTIKQLMRDTGAKATSVNFALPESQVFTRVIEVPQLSERELASAIKWESEQYIPLPLDQVNLDFTILRDSKETGTHKMEVLLVASPKALIDKYLNILEIAELTPLAAETEIIANSRALVRSIPSVKTVMVASLGAQTTDLSILHDGILAFARSIGAGGDAMTRALAQALDFTVPQAEEFKKTYGVDARQLEGKILAAVKPVLDTIIGEMKRAVAFYQEKYKEERVETLLLTGGTARLPGMVVYIAQNLGIEAQLANPWVGINKEARFNVLDNEGPVFSVAVGLGIREA